MTPNPDAASLRRSVTVLLVVVACAAATARIVRTERVYEPSMSRPDPADTSDPRGLWPDKRPTPMPTFGANDRSRWVTVRALVDEGHYWIGRRIDPRTGEYPQGYYDPQTGHYREDITDYKDDDITFQDGWGTIDKVMDPLTGKFYSSKPPLLPTLLAGEYWLLKHLFGLSIVTDRWIVIPVILITINVLPFAAFVLVLARFLERLGETDWGRLFVLATACFGTFLTTFAVTLNNHTPAAYTALFAVAPLLRGTELRMRDGIVSGLFAGLTAALELPALALVAALAGIILIRRPKVLLGFLPAVLLWAAAELGTNYIALAEWQPAYSKFGGPWYEFPGSYWGHVPTGPRLGIDYAYLKESGWAYLFHLLIGHHGIFSLTPVWLLTVVGIGFAAPVALRSFRRSIMGGDDRGWLALLTTGLSVVIIAYYVSRTENRNYGGWSAGLRWLFWLTPFWLLALAPAADRLAGSRRGRAVACALLAVTVFSVSYPIWNPWRHPWLYDLMDHLGWIAY
jgi:hypothetical protein